MKSNLNSDALTADRSKTGRYAGCASLYGLYVRYTGSGWVKNACMMCSAIM